MALTTNYSFDKPTVGVSDGTWGTSLNNNWDSIDTLLKAVSDVANAALPKAGGTMTGNLKVLTETYTLSDKGSALTGTVTLDCSAANFFALNTTGGGNVTIAFSNVPATGSVFFITVEITAGGAHTVTWPAAVQWPGGNAPVQTASGKDVYVLYTRDGGTTWNGNLVLEALS